MKYMTKAEKLLELRTKTDRQLVTLIDGLLQRCLVAEAERLVPLLRGAERRKLECKLAQMKELLPAKSVYAA